MNYIDCPVTRTLNVMGGRWKPVLLHYLMEKPRRAGELTRLIPQASPKMLTQQLRELENDNIVHREVYHQVPPKVEYSLTDFGESSARSWTRSAPGERRQLSTQKTSKNFENEARDRRQSETPLSKCLGIQFPPPFRPYEQQGKDRSENRNQPYDEHPEYNRAIRTASQDAHCSQYRQTQKD